MDDTDRQRPIRALGHHLRFHLPHAHLERIFGDDWFALKAEAFARFFGTPVFPVGQTILLNLAFSLQSAYAAPLILLAQSRQADRDKAHADADARHREALALDSQTRLTLATEQSAQILALLERNTELTETIRGLSERIETLTTELHSRFR